MNNTTSYSGGGRVAAFMIYALLFFMPMTVGATGVLALIAATFAETDRTPDWIRTHYRFQARTFWIGIVPTFLVFFASQFLIGTLRIEPLYMFAVVIPVLGWIAARCAMGFNHLLHGRAYPSPATWLV